MDAQHNQIPSNGGTDPLRQLFIDFGSKTYAELAGTTKDDGDDETVLHLDEGVMESLVLTAASRGFIVDAGRLIATDPAIDFKKGVQDSLVNNVAPLMRKLLNVDNPTDGATGTDDDATDRNKDFLNEVANVLFTDPNVYEQYCSWNHVITRLQEPRDVQHVPGKTWSDKQKYVGAYRAFGWLTDAGSPSDGGTGNDDLRKETQALRKAITEALRNRRQPNAAHAAAGAASDHAEDSTAPDHSAPHDSALSVFMRDMKNATPATFGAWATDTTSRSLLNGALGDAATDGTADDAATNAGHPTELARHMERWRGNATSRDDATSTGAAALLEALYDAAQKAIPINPRVMFVFLNWGDNLRPFYPYTSGFRTPYSYDGSELEADKPDIAAYFDWSEPLFGSTDNELWSRGSAAVLSNETDYIGRFVRATYGTPLQGGFMTDFYKGIATPDATQLIKAISASHDAHDDAVAQDAQDARVGRESKASRKPSASQGKKMVQKAMLELLALEIARLKDAIPQHSGADERQCGADGGTDANADAKNPSPKPLIFVVTEPFDVIKSFREQATASTDVMADVEPWQVIRWPHHSGSNGATFKATTLAYAYGRAAYALEEAFSAKASDGDSGKIPGGSDGESAVPARFPFEHEVTGTSLADGGESLYAWFDKAFRSCKPAAWAGQRTGEVAVRFEALLRANAKAKDSSEQDSSPERELKDIVDDALSLDKDLRAHKRPVDEISMERIREALFAEDADGSSVDSAGASMGTISANPTDIDAFMKALDDKLRQQGQVNRTTVRNAVLDLIGTTSVLYYSSTSRRKQSPAVLAEAFVKGWLKEKELIEHRKDKATDFDDTLAL